MAKKQKQPKRPISEEQRKSLLERLELAKKANPFHNPALRESKDQSVGEEDEGAAIGLRPHLTGYLQSPKSIKDFELLRKKSPEKALEFAAERVWGARSGPGTQRNQSHIGILVKVLTGSSMIPDKDSLPQPVVVVQELNSDTDKGS